MKRVTFPWIEIQHQKNMERPDRKGEGGEGRKGEEDVGEGEWERKREREGDREEKAGGRREEESGEGKRGKCCNRVYYTLPIQVNVYTLLFHICSCSELTHSTIHNSSKVKLWEYYKDNQVEFETP